MGSFADDVDGLTPHVNDPVRVRGWKPGVTHHRDRGEIEVNALRPNDIHGDDRSIIESLDIDLDPERWTVTQVRVWEQRAGSGEFCHYYRLREREAADFAAGGLRTEELIDLIRSPVPRRAPASTRPGTQLWSTGDWQVGKAGTENVIDALRRLPDRFEAAWREAGRPGRIVVIFGGDLGEGCSHFYPGMTFTIMLNERDQRRVVRELAWRVVARAIQLVGADHVEVAAVGGNHGEHRSAPGELLTDRADNRDVAAIEDIRWGMENHGDLEIGWHLPDDELTVCEEWEGVQVGIAHGHQIGKGLITSVKMNNWLDRQAGNRRPIGAADLVLTYHWHHFIHYWFGHRTWIGAPAEDDGSLWLAETAGPGEARPGSVTVDLLDGTVGRVRIV
ncbi:MAG: hypothetical protein AAGA90_20000 [Actinomycetota bacterium]